MHTLAILAIGLLVGSEGKNWLSTFITYFQNRKLLREITPTAIKKNRLCKVQHSWIATPHFDGTSNEAKMVALCQVCGLIPSMGKMAPIAAIDRVLDNKLIQETEAKIYRDFIAKEDEDIKKYFSTELQNGVSFDKLTALHGAGMTFGSRFRLFKSSKADEITKSLNRINA